MKYIFSGILMFLSVAIFAQSPTGVWYTQGKKGKVEIFQSDGKYKGKIIWLKEPNESDGSPKLDNKNPDPKKRKERIINSLILDGFSKKGDTWEGGTIYDPESGKVYESTMKMAGNNTLKVRGYWGIFYKTQTWTRAK